MAVRIGNCDIPNLSDIVESTFDNVMTPDFIYGTGIEFDSFEDEVDIEPDFVDDEIVE